MAEYDLRLRTKGFAISIIRFCDTLPKQLKYAVVEKQLIRCATSVGANCRSAFRAKSTPDFINKLKIVEEEADESAYWLEILEELGKVDVEQLLILKQEANEILAIVVSLIKKSRIKV